MARKAKSPKKKSKSHKSTKSKKPSKSKSSSKVKTKTKIKRLDQPPVLVHRSRVSPIRALDQRLSPYFGHDKLTQEAIPMESCQQFDLKELRQIAREANKQGAGIKGHMKEDETLESLCFKLIQKKILVLSNGTLIVNAN